MNGAEGSLIAGLDEGPGLVTRDITFSFYAFRWRRCTTCNFEIQRVLPLMAGILIFKCAEGAGVGDYSSRRRGREHKTTIFFIFF